MDKQTTLFTVGAHALIKSQAGEYLILKRAASDNYRPNLWDIPGGTVNAGEMVEDALSREIIEETCISRFKIGKVVHVYTNMDSFPIMQNIQIIYECEIQSNYDDVLISNDHSDYIWCKSSEFVNYELMPFLFDYIIKSGNFQMKDKFYHTQLPQSIKTYTGINFNDIAK